MEVKRYRGFDKREKKDGLLSTTAERSKAQAEYITDEAQGSIDASGKNPELNRTNREIIDEETGRGVKK